MRRRRTNKRADRRIFKRTANRTLAANRVVTAQRGGTRL